MCLYMVYTFEECQKLNECNSYNSCIDSDFEMLYPQAPYLPRQPRPCIPVEVSFSTFPICLLCQAVSFSDVVVPSQWISLLEKCGVFDD